MRINDTNYDYVRPGRGFKTALLAPVPLKDFVTNESRLEDGLRILVRNPKKAARSITLEFQIVGSSPSDFEAKKEAFFTELYKGEVKLADTGFTDEVFHLVYQGNSPTYSSGLTNTACKVSVQFSEPDPTKRV